MKLTEEHYLIAEANGISRSAVRTRVHKLKGWSIERAISEPIHKPKSLFTPEEKKILRKNGIPEIVAYNRLKYLKGWDRERALTEPIKTSRRESQ